MPQAVPTARKIPGSEDADFWRYCADCALVLHAIHGADGLDTSAKDRPFHWPLRRDVRSLRVGYVESLFESDRTESSDPEEVKAAQREWQQLNWRTLEVLRELGIELIPINLPNRYPVLAALSVIMSAESATGYDELTRSGRDDLLVRGSNAGILGGQLIPAVEYIASRAGFSSKSSEASTASSVGVRDDLGGLPRIDRTLEVSIE